MAPPRQRTAATQDDSRSEASSTTREQKTSTTKSRKAGHGPTSAAGPSRDAKGASNTANVTSAPAREAEADNLPKMNWPEMPLELLHSYRHAYKLPCPSAYASEYSNILLSRGIGLRSPTSIATQRARQAATATHDPQTNGNGSGSGSESNQSLHGNPSSGPNGITKQSSKKANAVDPRGALHRIVSEDRVSKNQLATAVRKHFNSAGLAEQEAIARFLYKVREEGRGRQFRLRFQP